MPVCDMVKAEEREVGVPKVNRQVNPEETGSRRRI